MNDIINKSIKVLKNQGTILYPTDTIWGIGCDATSSKAVEKIYRIKKRIPQKSFIILVNSIEMVKDYVEEFPSIANDIIKSVTEPLTIVYPKARKLAKNVMAKDKSIAIRIVQDSFCQELIAQYGKPIVSTSANEAGEESPLTFSKITDEIKSKVDYIVPQEMESLSHTKPSTIIKLSGDTEFEILRG